MPAYLKIEHISMRTTEGLEMLKKLLGEFGGQYTFMGLTMNQYSHKKVVRRQPPKNGTATWGTYQGVLYQTTCNGPCNEATWDFGIAYASFDTSGQAINVMKYLHGISIDGGVINVDPAEAKTIPELVPA